MPHYQESESLTTERRDKMVHAPSVNTDDYDLEEDYVEDSPEATPKHGTSVQSGWAAAAELLKPKGDYPNDFKFTESLQLVKFLEDGPFALYEQHWLDRSEGKRSFTCLKHECPLCDILGDKPRGKFAFNLMVVSQEGMPVQILTAPSGLGRDLKLADDDPLRGPLQKFYWAMSRHGTGPQTRYTLERVRERDLADEWDLDSEVVDAAVAKAVLYGPETVYMTPRSELLTIARSLVS